MLVLLVDRHSQLQAVIGDAGGKALMRNKNWHKKTFKLKSTTFTRIIRRGKYENVE